MDSNVHPTAREVNGNKPFSDLSDDEISAAIAEGIEHESPGGSTVEDREYLRHPSHGTASDVLRAVLGETVIYERESGKWFERRPGWCYFSELHDPKGTARQVLEAAVDRAMTDERIQNENVKELYTAAGKAAQKAQTRDFVAGALSFFSETVGVSGINWNGTMETMPTLDGVLDFSGPEVIVRDARPGEYYRDPLPFPAREVLTADVPSVWQNFLKIVFPDPDTRTMARQCMALAVRGRTTKLFQVWTNELGNGAKNTTLDVLSLVLTNRVSSISGSVILERGDASERRFGAAEMESSLIAAFDEVGNRFDIAAIKRLTSLSPIRVERKSEHPREIQQTWAMIALANELPRFVPADDQAFLARLLILPFRSVFVSDEDSRQSLLARGIEPARIHPARPHEEILSEMHPHRPGILRDLIETYIRLRDDHRLRPVQSSEASQARRSYQLENDDIGRFVEEYLIRDPDGFVANDRLESLYRDFSGEPRPKMKSVRAEIVRRLAEVRLDMRRVANGTGSTVKRGIAGLRERSEDDRNVVTFEGGFQVRERKTIENPLKTKIRPESLQRNSEDNGDVPALFEGGPDDPEIF